MAKITLAGYCDRFSARPGERLDIMVSAEGTDRAELQLVRLIHGDENPEGPGFIEREVDAPVNGTHAVAKQYTQLGSFVRVTDPESRLAVGGPFTLWAYIWARTPAKGRQGLLTRWQDADSSGYALEINEDGALAFRVGDGAGNTDALTADTQLIARQWYLVAASYDPASGEATLYQEPIENRYNNHLSKIVPLERLLPCERAAWGDPCGSGRGFFVGRRAGSRAGTRRLRHPSLQRQDRPRGRRRRGAEPRCTRPRT